MTDEQPKQPTAQPKPPVISRSFNDLLVPGVIVEVTAEEAEALGAFEEAALSEADAWEANGDPAEETEPLTNPAPAPITEA